MKKLMLLILLIFFLVFSGVAGDCKAGGLKKGFYLRKCPDAEEIVRNVTWSHVKTNPILPAKLLRMHFHDCFVRGCDGSVLINSTANNTAEKDAGPNLTLSGFDVIDDIKEQLEYKCPGIVSCADILALAARDSVSFQYKTPMWEVLTGRRDGNVSRQSEALANIPSPFFNFTQLIQSFKSKGLNEDDLVILSGGHTLGVGHCNLFSNRLYNFTGRADQDPSLNLTYANFLKTKCSPTDTTTTVEMDPGSSRNFDASYFRILLKNMGLFQSDAALLIDESARNTVEALTNEKEFFAAFATSMMRMGAVEVVTGSSGEIRKKCGVVNSNY